MLRNYYLVRGVEKSVQGWVAAGRPRDTWPGLEHLPSTHISIVADMYRALGELWIGQRIWNAPALDTVIDALKELDEAGRPALPKSVTSQ